MERKQHRHRVAPVVAARHVHQVFALLAAMAQRELMGAGHGAAFAPGLLLLPLGTALLQPLAQRPGGGAGGKGDGQCGGQQPRDVWVGGHPRPPVARTITGPCCGRRAAT